MAIGKPRGRNQARPVYVYDSRIKAKRYVGSRVKLRGEGGAQELERQKTEEFRQQARQQPAPTDEWTCARYADRWLNLKHGKGTRRPSPTTYRENENRLKPFLAEFGDRPLTSIERSEALDWSRQHPHQARAVSAMFADAFDDQKVASNPFANRRQEQPRGRRDIHPLTEAEVEQLADIAETVWGEYGRVVGGWIILLGWVGCRPGEAWQLTWDDVDMDAGEVTVRRVKPPYRTDRVVLPARAQRALLRMPGEQAGALFKTVQGKPYNRGNAGYYWRPVQAGLLATMTPQRRAEVTDGQPNVDPYALRHACASMLVARGLNEFEGSKQLGNSPAVFREVYLHEYRDLTNDRIRAAMGEGPKVVELKRRKGA